MTSKFAELGYDQADIDARLNDIFETIFHGSEDETFYYENEDGTGYLVDTGNDDVRTEGMSYGMMIAVQLDHKDIFDRIWAWVYKYMLIQEGKNAGYFRWSCQLDGTPNSEGSAPDGEEFFALTLLFAEKKWGNGEGEFNYGEQGRNILRHMVHNGDDGSDDEKMFNPETTYIKFVADMEISDPSYHLPHFYEVYSQLGNPEDKEFFAKAADESRKYLLTAMDEKTGMAAEYANYDGTPNHLRGHGYFFSDAYRVAANIGLDYHFTGNTDYPALKERVEHLQAFYRDQIEMEKIPVYDIEGNQITDEFTEDGQDLSYVKHPIALLCGLEQGSLITEGETAKFYVQKVWDTPLREGKYRYYDNLLYIFAFMALSGHYNNLAKD